MKQNCQLFLQNLLEFEKVVRYRVNKYINCISVCMQTNHNFIFIYFLTNHNFKRKAFIIAFKNAVTRIRYIEKTNKDVKHLS